MTVEFYYSDDGNEYFIEGQGEYKNSFDPMSQIPVFLVHRVALKVVWNGDETWVNIPLKKMPVKLMFEIEDKGDELVTQHIEENKL